MELPGKVKQNRFCLLTEGWWGQKLERWGVEGESIGRNAWNLGGICGVIRKPSAMEDPWDL